MMKPDELAEDLANFWFSAIAVASWEGRLKILKQIDAQLLADIERRSDYEAVAPRFLAAVIERLGFPPVENRFQAQIFARSACERHRDAATVWLQRMATGTPPDTDPGGRERRRFARKAVDAISEIWVHERRSPCHLLDLSLGGVRVTLWEPAPDPGTPVRLALPDEGLREATVVFRDGAVMGLRFAVQPATA
jgi:hypothetical protein